MNYFQIIQYNAHNAHPVMASFLSDKAVQKADVIAVQEPWINSQSTTTHYPNKATHQLVFPKELEGERARVCLFVSKRIDPGSWSCKTVSKGYQLLKLRRNHLDGWTDLFMHNIYNNDDGETVEKLNRELAQRPYAEHILIGDMNLHHPTWSGIGSKAKATAAAERLLDIAGIHNLSLTTETGSPTWRRNEQASVLDLTFVSNTLAERVVECQVGTDHGSDHYPVVTTIDIGTPPYEPPKRRNWKATDDKKLIEFIERQLTNTTTNTNNTTTTNTTTNPQNLTTADDVEAECQAFIQIINDAVDISTPWAIPSQWANPSFTPECQEAVKEVRQLRRRHERTGDPYDKELYKAARNRKTRLIKIALRRYHRRKVQEVIEGPGGMWRMSKWARNRQGAYDQGVTPSIKIPGGLAETVEEKAAAFQQAFFPVPPPADLSDIDSKVINHDPTEINRGPIRFPEITHQEIKQAVKASPPDKAPGEDGLPNSLWHKLIEIPTVLDTISRIYNACIRLGTNPTHFQKSITVVLRKAGKRDYQLAKSYRPVALLNTLGKFLEAVVARRISYAVETYKLLPDTHFGGRKGISVDHAIQSIIGRIRRAWGKGKIASMLLLDVSGAYDNVSHERLLYNLRKRGLGQLAPWVKAFLTSRSTRIRIPEGVSESIPTPTGIPQGSPLSPILYLIYNADLVEGCEGVKTSGWVDDVAFIVIGKDEHETISKLQKACQYADAWAARHASVFDPKKYALIHFVNPESGGEEHTPLVLQGTTVQATTTAERYLGVWLDPGLTFQHHRQQMLAKAGVSLQALRGLTGSTWGASLSAMRAIYQAVMIPQMLFGAAAWHSPLTSTLRERSYVKQFANIQSRAACLMSGAFKTTAREALDIELHLLPMQQQLDRLVQLAAIRIRTGPAYAVPKTMLVERGHMQKQRGGYTPMEAQTWKKGGCLTTPLGPLASTWESRKAYIQAPWTKPPRVYIEERERAINTHKRTTEQLYAPARLYTDGSGYQGGIGAAVYPAYPYRRNEARLCNMGTDDDATVYAAELRAIEMALEVIKERFNDDNEWRDCLAKSGVVIFTDNQATLRAIQNPRMPSGQVYLEGCLRLLEWCNDKIQVELRWVPAHEGIPGNEAADMYAKEAATTTETNIHDTNANANTNANTNDNTNVNTNVNHNRSIRLAAAASKSVKRESTIAWEKAWTKGGSKRTARRTRRMIEVPSKSNLTYWKGLRKATTSVLIQLRTGIIGLAEYLSKIKRSDSPRCQCDLGNQSVKHVLLECPLLKELRSEMVEELFMEGVSTTLGEQAMLTEVKAAPIVAKFMIASGLLGQFQSVDSVAMGKEQGEEDSKPKPTQDTANVGETGNTSQWPGARSAEVTSHQRTWRTTHAADEDEEAWRHDPNLFVFDLPE
jgi:ribonuclease HI